MCGGQLAVLFWKSASFDTGICFPSCYKKTYRTNTIYRDENLRSIVPKTPIFVVFNWTVCKQVLIGKFGLNMLSGGCHPLWLP